MTSPPSWLPSVLPCPTSPLDPKGASRAATAPPLSFSLLTYTERRKAFNVGDYVQSLAARQYLPRVDHLLNRDRLAGYDGERTKLILNGWFTDEPATWCPSRAIDPLLVSFHLNSMAASELLAGDNLGFFRRHAPVGCRDRDSVRRFQAAGVDAFFTGCLTLTLTGYARPDADRREVILADHELGLGGQARHPRLKALFSSAYRAKLRRRDNLRRFLAPGLVASAARVEHDLPAGVMTEQAKLDTADALLRRYAQARLVITARIHCALPCLAMGTPVIFVNGYHKESDTCRFDGLLELFNRIDLAADGTLTNNFGHPADRPFDGSFVPPNPTRHLPLAAELRRRCEAFIAAA